MEKKDPSCKMKSKHKQLKNNDARTLKDEI